jgi:hypothetical protein
MKLCYENMQNQTKNLASRGEERGILQIVKLSKQKEATITLGHGTRGFCRRFRPGITLSALEHRWNSRTAKKTHTTIALANNSGNHQATQAGRKAASNNQEPTTDTNLIPLQKLLK